nr:alpha/beta hydrolase [uncultured Lichenicoccus sp.]
MTSPTLDTDADLLERFRVPDRNGSYLGVSKHGFHRIAYVEWGNPQSDRVAICVHGLSRQGRDFDLIAAEMARRGWRVICPDLVGRGRSDWLREPGEYTLPQYVSDLAGLVARLDVPKVDWIGTSLGGIIGILMAGQRQSPVGRLVVNDIGPFVTWQVLQRLGDAVRDAPLTFPDLCAATGFVRTTLPGFGPLSDEKWEHLARHGFSENKAGGWRKLADSDIAGPFRTSLLFNLSIWNYWDQITCPTLVLRGEHSDVLPAAIATEMTQRGPEATLVEFEGCGHAPALMDAGQINTVVEWLGQE